jgi:DNA invertase Pin-like site-specific DNA recombinase
VADLGYLVEQYFNKSALLSVSEQIDTRSAGGRLVLNVLASVSQWERESTSERTSAAMQTMKANGLYTGGKTPYGKKLVNGVLVADAYEQTVIGIAKELKAKGKTLKQIAHVLAHQGYMTRNDRIFQNSSIHRMVA